MKGEDTDMEMIPFCIVFVAMTTVVTTNEYETISTPAGKMKGINVSNKFGNVAQFLNIPFAKPPTGDLRFRKPVPLDTWDDIYDATEYGPSCIQNLDYLPELRPLLPNEDLSEDCLHLNIFVPNKVNPNNRKSVMLWIHGGGMFVGQSSMYDGSLIALGGDVIVVTINYRLGIFGFLDTNDASASGNYGLWDQILALKWVQKNIAAFGGDPNSVTIFGESAGSISVVYLMTIPSNRGLFHRAIAQSGAAMSFVPFVEDPPRVARLFADKLNCTETQDISLLVKCMQGQEWKNIIDAQDVIFFDQMASEDKLSFKTLIYPSIDGELFTKENPHEDLYKDDSEMKSFFRSIDFLAGTTSLEGSVSLMFLMMFQEKYNFNITDGIPTAVLCELLSPAVGDAFLHDPSGVAAKALCDFFKNEDQVEQGKQILNLYSDISFVAPTVEALKIHSAGNTQATSFQYLFSRQPDNHDLVGYVPAWGEGAPHGSDLEFLYPFKTTDPFSKDETAQLFNRVVKYWTNFAKSGNPNGDGLPKWPRYEPQGKKYLNLDVEVTVEKDIYPERMKLMLETIPDIVRKAKARKQKSEL